MPDAGCRLILDPIAGRPQSQRQIDVLEIGAEVFREQSRSNQRPTPQEDAGAARRCHRLGSKILVVQRFEVAALPGEAAGIVAIAGAVDQRRLRRRRLPDRRADRRPPLRRYRRAANGDGVRDPARSAEAVAVAADGVTTAKIVSAVIANEARQSRTAQQDWIASTQEILAMTDT